uniref:CCR4-NOT transcription complex subunit 9 n=1 Tax=Lygus hesperus TaxID=30085 RepID=A0A0A9WBX2_LYGHE
MKNTATVAMHPETRTPFLEAMIPVYLYPFLLTTTQTSAFEQLRHTCLGVISTLLKNNDRSVVELLLTTNFLPHCYTSIEFGGKMTKALGVYILDKIIFEDWGLTTICRVPFRLSPCIITLNNLITSLAGYPRPCSLILRHVVRCYVGLARNKSAREALRRDPPFQLTDGTFLDWLEGDWDTKILLHQLLEILVTPEVPTTI